MNELTEKSSTALTAADMQSNVNLIQQVMKQIMKGPSKENPDGVHYGIIPGTKRMTLYQAGAEKLAMAFHLRPIIDRSNDVVKEDLGNGHREVTVYCHIINQYGQELATGIGSCSTLEVKFRYRGGMKKGTGVPLPKEYWNLDKEGKKKQALDLIGGEGFAPGKVDGKWEICEAGAKMENPDIADTYNTVLLIARKRAFVGGIRAATAASDIFTQDEDIIIPPIDHEEPINGKPITDEPQEKQPEHRKRGEKFYISELQAKRFFAVYRGAGKTDAEAKDYLKRNYGIDKSSEIDIEDYKKICEWAEKPAIEL